MIYDGWDVLWCILFENEIDKDDPYNYKEEFEKEKYYENKYD